MPPKSRCGRAPSAAADGGGRQAIDWWVRGGRAACMASFPGSTQRKGAHPRAAPACGWRQSQRAACRRRRHPPARAPRRPTALSCFCRAPERRPPPPVLPAASGRWPRRRWSCRQAQARGGAGAAAAAATCECQVQGAAAASSKAKVVAPPGYRLRGWCWPLPAAYRARQQQQERQAYSGCRDASGPRSERLCSTCPRWSPSTRSCAYGGHLRGRRGRWPPVELRAAQTPGRAALTKGHAVDAGVSVDGWDPRKRRREEITLSRCPGCERAFAPMQRRAGAGQATSTHTHGGHSGRACICSRQQEGQRGN